ncbi:MAG: hypothetical protein IJD57_08300 [Candidatus Gastranaerophilales bacterium]|nr:hypothetical protein [Candidatus Gastranaerophilales bacterium]
MYRVFKNLTLSVLSVALAGNIAFAVQNEYKNSLLKVELQKTSDNLYSVSLYTQNNFKEPVKIIKKSDLNYYILLPETKNKAATIVTNSKDIRNVTVESFKYEGADVDNGYVKVNINTSKPLYFNVSTKLNTSSAPQKQAVATLQPKILPSAEKVIKEEATQKKNFELQTKTQVKAPVSKSAPVPKKAIPVLEEAIVDNQNFLKEDITDEILEQEKLLNEDFVSQNDGKLENIEVIKDEALLESGYLEENYDEISQIANEKKGLFSNFKKKLKNKLTQYNLDLKDLFLMMFVGVISFFIMFALLLRKQKNVRLRNKNELLKTTSPFVPKEEDEQVKNDGQYFVFDNGIKQTGLISPATTDEVKKYELSSYEPDLKDNYVPGSFREYVDNNEFDIIQKVLKEQAPRDYENLQTQEDCKQYVQQPIEKPIEKPKVEQKAPLVKQEKIEPKKEEYIEPTVLSKVEIAPERGFMCVLYNDNINLMGYIFDDVYPLYNFKQAKLESYDIKYRLSDKTSDGANFIVKIDKTKVLVSVKNSSMALEVVL